MKTERLPCPEFKPNQDSNPEITQAELESVMAVYARPLDDFLEMFIQFGYVLLFSPAFPLAAACASFNNLLEIKVDAFKLCNTVQRPFGRRVKDIGAWQKAMELLGVLGVIVNCALIGQSGLVQCIWPDLSWGGQILIVVVLEHVILASKMIIDILVPDVPHWVRIETAKQEHFRREAFKRESRLLSHTQTPSSEHLQNQIQNNQPEPGSPDASSPRFNRLDQINRSKRRSITPMVRDTNSSFFFSTGFFMNRSEQLEMMGKEESYDTFEQDNLVVQEEYNIEQENSIKLEARSMKILSTKIGGINTSDIQESLPTFAIPSFDIQEFLFGKSEDLKDTKKNNQEVVDQYLAEHGLPLTTNMTLSNVPTGWVLNHDKNGNKNQDEGIFYPVTSGYSTLDPLSPLFNGTTPNIHDEKTGISKKSLQSHPYARSSSKKQQNKKQNIQAETTQFCSSDTNGLDADDGCFGDHFTDQ
ncbi:unnamed protein product [Caenorhabditis brenneri]